MTSSTVPLPPQLQTESRTNEAFPELTPVQLARIEPHGRRRRLVQGEVVGEPGQPVTKIFVVLSGQLDAVTPLQTSDRKSTRLNSSHGYISYAVFCLKKKRDKKTYYQTYYMILNFTLIY